MTFIRAELRFKNATLLTAIKETGLSIPEFCKRSEVNYYQMNCFINFRSFPSDYTMAKICEYLGLPAKELFLKYLPQYKLKCDNTIKWDITEPQYKVLSSGSNQKLLTASFRTDLERVLNTLPKNRAEVIRKFFIEEKTLDEIGDEMDLTRERVRQLKESGIKRLRHKLRADVLRDYL